MALKKTNLKPMVRLTKEEIRKKQDFIRHYMEAQNASDGSTVDANANVSTKTVATLGAELNKDINIQINRQTLYDKIEELYGTETADKYIELLENHTIYKHDETSIAPGVAYTYSPNEVVVAKFNGKTILTSFEKLFELADENPVEAEAGVFVKTVSKDMIEVKDKNGWTLVTHLTRKERHRPMVKVETYNGEALTVTDNHPLILSSNGEVSKDAILCKNLEQYSLPIDLRIEYSDDKIGLKYFEFPPKISSDDGEVLGKKIKELDTKNEYDETLLQNVLEYEDNFILCVLFELCEKKENCYYFNVNSEKLRNQLATLFRACSIRYSREGNTLIVNKYFEINKDFYQPFWSPIKSIELVEDEMEYIYDITTESHTLIVNGLWCHNCVAISMYPFLESGMKKLGGESGPPKHLESFCGSFANLIFAISSQFAGACLYKDQELTFTIQDIPTKRKIKEFVSEHLVSPSSFSFNGSVWEYADISDKNIFVQEAGKFTKVKKVYRRKYSDLIYKIVSETGKTALVSKDHKFKHFFGNRYFETKAEDLQIGDVLVVNTHETLLTENMHSIGFIQGEYVGKNTSTIENIKQENFGQGKGLDWFQGLLSGIKSSGHLDVDEVETILKKRGLLPDEEINNKEAVAAISVFDNDDEYVYEIETGTHWYSCGGFITHNCATPEMLLYFYYFAQKDFGKDFLKTHKDLIEAKLQHVV